MSTTPKTRSIIIEHSDGSETRVDEIPNNAKITYGPVQPGRHGYGDNILRVYTSQSNQLAVFRNVVSFRDLSLTVSTREVTTVDARTETRDPSGRSSARYSAETRGDFVEKLTW